MIGKLSRTIVLVCAMAPPFWVFPAKTAPITSIYQFTGLKGQPADGAYPVSGLISDSTGNLYGTTAAGGSTGCKIGCGTVFELSPSGTKWNESVLYSFGGPPNDGAVPVAGLVIDSAGNLYGTTSQGGSGLTCNGYGCGTVFKLSQSGGKWTETFLYSFKGGGDGQDPRAPLVMATDGSGNLFGTTAEGGITTPPKPCGYFQTGCGTIFEIAPDGTHTTLYLFGGAPGDGESPRAALTLDNDGNLYGTTISGGSTFNSPVCVYESCGTVFELMSGSTTDKILYSFKGGAGDGGNPVSSVIFDTNGNLDGTTLYGGSSDCLKYGCGTIFQLPSTGGETLLHPFSPADGEAPVAGLIPDLSGNLESVACGERCNGGTPGKQCPKGCQNGTAYRIPANNTKRLPFAVIGVFNNKDGSSPSAPLLLNQNTNTLYGTTQNGGALKNCPGGCGTVFSIALGRQ